MKKVFTAYYPSAKQGFWGRFFDIKSFHELPYPRYKSIRYCEVQKCLIWPSGTAFLFSQLMSFLLPVLSVFIFIASYNKNSSISDGLMLAFLPWTMALLIQHAIVSCVSWQPILGDEHNLKQICEEVEKAAKKRTQIAAMLFMAGIVLAAGILLVTYL